MCLMFPFLSLFLKDPNSWLSGHSLISAARNSFSKLMDNLSVLMETVQGNPCGCRAYLERDSLIQRLACGLHRVNAQALEAGFYDRLPSTRNIAILQQEVFKLSRRLHTAEVESHSLHLQLAEFKWTFNEMQKDAEKAHRLQEQLNALQNKIITQDNIRDELDKALQREHEARLLLQEHQQRLQELSDRLELHTRADPDRNQVSKASLMSLHDATEELRRDQVLNHQKSLLKDIEQDRQRLHETLQEAEHALQQAAKDKELMINHMKAVDATLNAIKDQATASGAAAATLLPSLKFETLSEETVSSRPEVIAFQNVLKSFMELYSLASARHEALTTGRESSGVHIKPEAAVTPPAPPSKEPFWRRIGRQLAKTPPAHARDSNESVGPRFVPKGDAAPHDPESNDIFQPRVSPQASVTAPATPAPTLSPKDIFQPRVSPQASVTAPATPAPTLSPAAQWREPRHRHFSCAPESQLDQNYGQDFWLLQPETDLSSDVICHSTHTVSGSNTTAGVRPDRNYTLSASNIPSSVVTGRNYSMSETNIPSSVTPGRTGFGSSMDISSHVIPGRNYSMSGINIPSIVTPGSTGFGSSMDISSHMRPIRTYSTSETNIPSSVTPGSTGFGSSMDISSHMRPIRTYSMSETNIPSSVTPGSTSFGSSMDISSHMRPIRTYRVSSANTSNVTPSRRGIGSSLDTFINLIPTTTDTGSSMDASSRMTQSRTFTVSSVNMPSRLTENRTGTGSSVNTSFHFRPHRTSSLPSVRSSSQDESSTRRNQGI
uniref:Uncharacterized protein n=1 Tax=Cyanistes caeruleus TaxID=156563 RepID=A0A8C0V5L3_CYACU